MCEDAAARDGGAHGGFAPCVGVCGTCEEEEDEFGGGVAGEDFSGELVAVLIVIEKDFGGSSFADGFE